jgi:hypothetical protein
VQLAASLPADPREFLQADAPYARIEALHAVGLDDFAEEEMDELVRRSLADTRRLYALATVYAQDSRHYLSLRNHAPPLPRPGAERAARGPPDVLGSLLSDRLALRGQRGSGPRGRRSLSGGGGGARGVVLQRAGPLPGGGARPHAAHARHGQAHGAPARSALQRRRAPRRAFANLTLGSAHLAGLLKEFGDPRLAVAAYNAGATPVRQWWKARTTDDLEVFVELIPFTETRGFVRRVMLAWEEYRRLYGSAAGARP